MLGSLSSCSGGNFRFLGVGVSGGLSRCFLCLLGVVWLNSCSGGLEWLVGGLSVDFCSFRFGGLLGCGLGVGSGGLFCSGVGVSGGFRRGLLCVTRGHVNHPIVEEP